MKILNECSFIKDIEEVENFYGAKYVLETCVKDNNGSWLNFPTAIFYTDKAHPKGSNYFALYRGVEGKLMIANGLSAVDGVEFTGIECNGEVVYSRYRHDYRGNECGSYIDGGRDYPKYGGNGDIKLVKFIVVKERLVICES